MYVYLYTYIFIYPYMCFFMYVYIYIYIYIYSYIYKLFSYLYKIPIYTCVWCFWHHLVLISFIPNRDKSCRKDFNCNIECIECLLNILCFKGELAFNR